MLASGDGDFDLALARVQKRFDTETEVYGVEQLTADSLIDVTDTYFPIEEELLL